ncbi:hypothetical protein F5Y04DRAFT_248552, partial [Hypomontagnella monticulosa]
MGLGNRSPRTRLWRWRRHNIARNDNRHRSLASHRTKNMGMVIIPFRTEYATSMLHFFAFAGVAELLRVHFGTSITTICFSEVVSFLYGGPKALNLVLRDHSGIFDNLVRIRAQDTATSGVDHGTGCVSRVWKPMHKPTFITGRLHIISLLISY